LALPQWELIVRLLAASALGSVIGFERERSPRAAGIRTHMLVCVGACLFMIVSAYGFNNVLGDHVVLDPSRVAAQVVSGIGFLGAGSIMLRREAIKGLTTAASIWATAAIGVAAGGGLYTAATASTVIIIVILAGLKPIEARFGAARASLELHLQARRGEASLAAIEEAVALGPTRVKQLMIKTGDQGERDELTLILTGVSPGETAKMIKTLERLPFVLNVDDESAKSPHSP
jgi:putative Mg2+ transporter-C (MgtC) family protein